MQIQPFQQFYQGKFVPVEYIEIVSQYDDLVGSVTFHWNLKLGDMTTVVGGSTALGEADPEGSDYKSWDSSESGAYKIVADRLGLTLIGT